MATYKTKLNYTPNYHSDLIITFYLHLEPINHTRILKRRCQLKIFSCLTLLVLSTIIVAIIVSMSSFGPSIIAKGSLEQATQRSTTINDSTTVKIFRNNPRMITRSGKGIRHLRS